MHAPPRFFFLFLTHFFCPSIYRAIHLSVFDPRPTSYQWKISEIYQAIAFLELLSVTLFSFYFQRSISDGISFQRIGFPLEEAVFGWARRQATHTRYFVDYSLKKEHQDSLRLSSITKLFIYTSFFSILPSLSRFPKFTWFLFKIYYYLDELSLQRWSPAHRERAVSFKCLWRMDLRQQLVPGKRVATSNAVSPNPLLRVRG